MKTKVLALTLLALSLLLNACSPVTSARSSGDSPTPVVESLPPDNYKTITIDHVGMEAREGSPIPVDIVASGTWPDLCAQIASVDSRIDGFKIDVTILASTAAECPPDHLGLPFRFALPLNMVEMKAGTYTITVNGVSTTFEWPLSSY